MRALLKRFLSAAKPVSVTQPELSPAAALETVEAEMLNRPQVDTPTTHRFGPGVYLREMEAPAGATVLGHEHTTEHWNIVLTGRARVFVSGEWRTIKAGDVFLSPAGSRKLGVVEETMRFLTIHPTDETRLDALEALLIRKSETFLAHEIVRALENQPEASA